MVRKQAASEVTDTHITDIVTKANHLSCDQERIMQHLITGLNNQLKPMLMMKCSANLQEACRDTGTAKEAARAQTAQWDGVESTLKDLVKQLKLDKSEKKVSAAQPSTSPPSPQQPNHCTRFSNMKKHIPGGDFARHIIPFHIHEN